MSGNSELEKACALYTSMLLRHGADIHYVIKQQRSMMVLHPLCLPCVEY